MAFCWMYRLIVGDRLDANRPLPRFVQRHLRGCPPCRNFQALEVHLARRLRAEVPRRLQNQPSPYLRPSVMAAVRQTPAESAPKSLLLIWGPAAALLALVAGLGVLTRTPASSRPQRPASADVTADLAEWLGHAERMPNGQTLLRWSQDFDRPLQTELESVVGDAKSAMQLLAVNFLPEQLVVRVAEP